MVAIVVEALTHRRSVMTSLWAVPKMKRTTMPTKVIEDEIIEETTTVEVLGIGKTVNQEMKTKTLNLERTKFMKDLVSNKGLVEYLDLADLGASINLAPYSLYTSLLKNTLKPTRISIRESSLDDEFKEFMAIEIEEILKQEEEVEDNLKELPLEENIWIKTSIQDPKTNLVMKPLPKQLEYACLEKESLLPVVIFALLKEDEKKRLVSILKKHKETFAWKTFDIPGISPSFFKHKINFEDDAKSVIQ
nr:reverse transcriptase domain-containing protein [Tanacetum cinerariifolium]GFA10773.1 reverse transcriptase domain-containing protein [Tanacetum cinerariifolium]